jgi:hypothetical protein
MIINEFINKTNFFYSDEYVNSNLGQYYYYIVSLLKTFFLEEDVPYEVNFGINSLKKDINLDFQYEHTIIKSGDKYNHRIERYDYLNNLDCIFDYTNTNVYFLSTFNELHNYVKKNIYIPPLIYDDYSVSNINNRVNDITTIHNWSKRRGDFFNKLKHDNIDNVLDKNSIRNILNTYKILLNIHQTDVHSSFEELRVAPALSTGILIISEDVPFKEQIPYNEHIIWCSYENIEKTIEDVLTNYEYYVEKKLTGLSTTIKNIKKNTDEKIKTFFKNYD